MILNSSIDKSYIYVHLSNMSQPKGIVHICHGKAEHIGRYKWLTSKLNNDGYHVISIDHRGHGKRIHSPEDIGKFTNDENGWEKVVNDLYLLINDTKKTFPDLKQFIFAHSMGSWIALSLLKKELMIDGLILSASAKYPQFLITLQKLIIKIDIFINGRNKLNNVMERLTTKRFNNNFKPNRTDFDWISDDEDSVDNYIQDELCGFKVTNGLWLDMVEGIESTFKDENYMSNNKNLRILLVAGSKDPVGDNGKGVERLYIFLKNNFKNISLFTFGDGRHEIFSDLKKHRRYKLLTDFFDEGI
tara:strand:+ start:85 stop:990 length:906 start_codon:yes stop_codon:yes gene_type:complete